MSDTPSIKNLPLGLLITRISIVLFLLPWVIGKFTQPESTIGLFKHLGSDAIGICARH